MHEHKSMIPIWFFIGLLLLIYGVLILGEGLYELSAPGSTHVVRADVHAGIWWGALLLGAGLFYTLRYLPKRGK